MGCVPVGMYDDSLIFPFQCFFHINTPSPGLGGPNPYTHDPRGPLNSPKTSPDTAKTTTFSFPRIILWLFLASVPPTTSVLIFLLLFHADIRKFSLIRVFKEDKQHNMKSNMFHKWSFHQIGMHSKTLVMNIQ